jgi:hypothetical protein
MYEFQFSPANRLIFTLDFTPAKTEIRTPGPGV